MGAEPGRGQGGKMNPRTLPTFSEAVKAAHDPAGEKDQRGAILRRLRAGYEAQMTADFSLPLSRLIDDLVQQEESA